MMVCYRAYIPVDVKVAGVTADGHPTFVLPGEYLATVLTSKVQTVQPLVRFVGADPTGRDVHVPFEVVRTYLAESANDRRLRIAEAA